MRGNLHRVKRYRKLCELIDVLRKGSKMKNNRAGDTSQRCGNSPAIIFSQQSAYDLNKLVKPKTAAELCDKAKEIDSNNRS